VCWSYSTEYHPCSYGIAGQARNDDAFLALHFCGLIYLLSHNDGKGWQGIVG